MTADLSLDKAEEYRRQADQCRERAEATSNIGARLTWLELAGHWQTLARKAEASRKPLE
jgi:hypothetical protein